MAKYHVTIVQRPENWSPESSDDVPLDLSDPVGILAESSDLFEAVGRAMEYNESDESQQRQRWAIVIEPGSAGRVLPTARLCTPISYQVMPIWWPDGWEPHSPRDVPNCVWEAQDPVDSQSLSYPQAETAVLALNRQCMNQPGSTWYIIVAVENEPVSRTITCDASGAETTTEVRRMHTIRPDKGGTGDCSHCPAGTFPCAKADWRSQSHTVPATHSRPFTTDLGQGVE